MIGGLVILSVVGVVLVGLLALILGIVALARINRSGGALKGRGLAIAAIILGALMLFAPILGLPLLWLAAGTAAPERSARAVPSLPAEPPSNPQPSRGNAP